MKKSNKIFICFLIFIIILSCARAQDNPSLASSTQETAPSANIEVTAPQAEPPMVYYDGSVLNIFFHPLVSRPQDAFRSSHRSFFLEWYVTAGEYKKVLDELYAANYVLVDINELYEITNVNGQKRVTGKRVLVPQGKKPMILSIDDLSYYDFVRENASVYKLIIDDNNRIAAWTDTASGGEISYDLDVVTYLEVFLAEHPDFSVRGAKGIIALTGYEGVLGYQTHVGYEGVTGTPNARILNSPEYLEEKAKAIAVVNRLKELGWHFASHSWGHLNMPNIPMSWFMNDTNRWDREVRPILGDTDLYIYPFGAGVESIEEKHRVLRERGFSVFFGVGAGFTFREMQSYIYFDRRNIDGQYFRTFRNNENRLFDIDRVIDDQARRIR
ncbi:MAG: hypothetical protein FWB83_06690 [Treponema sp.]|nr:hypothetical protein [Treponema sp.]